MGDGWLKLHRKFLEWEWFDDAEMVKLFIYLMLSANHKPKTWRGAQIGRGQFVTGRDRLAAATNITVQRLRSCLKRMEQTGEVTQVSTSAFTVITVCHYDDYQGKEASPKKAPAKEDVSPTTTRMETLKAVHLKYSSSLTINPIIIQTLQVWAELAVPIEMIETAYRETAAFKSDATRWAYVMKKIEEKAEEKKSPESPVRVSPKRAYLDRKKEGESRNEKHVGKEHGFGDGGDSLCHELKVDSGGRYT